MMSEPLLKLRQLTREFPAGDEMVAVLKGIDLDIHAGEMIAIIGASGSGKSTLMNILGCLDKPSSGSYQVAGRETAEMQPDELAQLRREHFGFIFQRYHLLADLSAQRNVEVPAIYAGKEPLARHARARAVLERLGLGHRLDYRPGHLSGGQQQRVSIARALINGGEVILADEPTGALDSASGEEVMRILEELNAEGHTIILVTHDAHVAQHARRIIEISDGEITADRMVGSREQPVRQRIMSPTQRISGWRALTERFVEAFRMATIAMMAHRMRTFLTMLGIIIGIASVVSVVALGTGAQQKILADINSSGTNTLEVFAGRGFGDLRAAAVNTLTVADGAALTTQPFVDGVTPQVSTNQTARYREIAASAQITGVGSEYFRVRGRKLATGSLFDAAAEQEGSQVAVIEQSTADKFFAGTNPIGEVLLLGSVPVRVIGVLEKNQNGMFNSNVVLVYAPYTTVTSRLIGSNRLQSLTVRIADSYEPKVAEAAVRKLLTMRHGETDFIIQNSDSIREQITRATGTLTLLVSAIAVISLVVGGIGVMNIMLVSVIERTREIGVRMAVGARQTDIMQQFLIEAVLVCLVGGVIGVTIAWLIAVLVEKFAPSVSMLISSTSMIAAFACCTAIGVGFGFLPARNAARLDPIESLARD
ncbi:MAG: MacB family efflux pump subunit [Steroidobacteraceae bacterium]